MKKFIRLLFFVPLLLSILLMPACSDDGGSGPSGDPLVGTWNLASIRGNFYGQVLTITAQMAEIAANITLSSDGTFTATWDMGEEVDTENGQWSSNGSTITLTSTTDGVPATTTWPYTLSDGNNTLVVTVAAEDLGLDAEGFTGQYELNFTRQ